MAYRRRGFRKRGGFRRFRRGVRRIRKYRASRGGVRL